MMLASELLFLAIRWCWGTVPTGDNSYPVEQRTFAIVI